MEADQKLVDALLHERAGYARAGRQARVQQVDAELKRLGYTPEPVQVAGEPVSVTEPPKRRAPRGRQTASQSAPHAVVDSEPDEEATEAEEAEVAGDGDSDAR